MPIIRDYINPKDLPYTADVVIVQEDGYYILKLRGENYMENRDSQVIFEEVSKFLREREMVVRYILGVNSLWMI